MANENIGDSVNEKIKDSKKETRNMSQENCEVKPL